MRKPVALLLAALLAAGLVAFAAVALAATTTLSSKAGTKLKADPFRYTADPEIRPGYAEAILVSSTSGPGTAQSVSLFQNFCLNGSYAAPVQGSSDFPACGGKEETGNTAYLTGAELSAPHEFKENLIAGSYEALVRATRSYKGADGKSVTEPAVYSNVVKFEVADDCDWRVTGAEGVEPPARAGDPWPCTSSSTVEFSGPGKFLKMKSGSDRSSLTLRGPDDVYFWTYPYSTSRSKASRGSTFRIDEDGMVDFSAGNDFEDGFTHVNTDAVYAYEELDNRDIGFKVESSNDGKKTRVEVERGRMTVHAAKPRKAPNFLSGGRFNLYKFCLYNAEVTFTLSAGQSAVVAQESPPTVGVRRKARAKCRKHRSRKG